MFSHIEEIVVFLFSFWGHFEYCGSPFIFSVLHVSKSKLSSQLTTGKDSWGLFFPFIFAFPPPQLENMRQILFMYAVTSKGADMLLSLKKNPELFILQRSTRALKLESPSLGPPGRLWGALCCSLKAAPKCMAKISATESSPCILETDTNVHVVTS